MHPFDLARRFVAGARRALDAAARPLAALVAPGAPPPRASAAGLTVAGTYEGLRALSGDAPAHLAPVPAGAPDPATALAPVLAALSSPAFDDGPFADARAAVRQAIDLARAGDAQAARRALVAGAATALMVLPDADRAALGRELLAARFAEGLDRLERGEAEAAAGSFRAALAADPLSAVAFEGLLAAAALGADSGPGPGAGPGPGPCPDWVREAVDAIDEAARAAPLGEAAYLRLADLFARAGRDPVRAIEHGLAQTVVDPAARLRLLEAALRHRPAHGPTLRRLGFARYIAGDAAAAVGPLEAAARAGEDVSLLLGLARLRGGDRAAGLEALGAHVAGHERPNVEAYVELGRADLEAGRIELAAERLAAATTSGDPYRTRAYVLLARLALERGDLDEADRLLWAGPDTCEAESIEMFDRLAAALRGRAGGEADLRRAARAEQEAADMRALPPAFQAYGFVSNPLGQPALVAHDAGGRLYRGHRRSTGEAVLLRGRAPHRDDVPGRLPRRAPTPFVLEPLASGRLGPRFWTVYPDPGLTPLAAVLERSREKAIAIAPAVLRGLAAALCDISASGPDLAAGFLLPERILLTSASGPLLLPFDPLDAPLVPATVAPAPDVVAPEVASGGPAAVSPASDVFGLAALARLLLGDAAPRRLAPLLEAATAADPVARPPAAALLVAFLRDL